MKANPPLASTDQAGAGYRWAAAVPASQSDGSSFPVIEVSAELLSGRTHRVFALPGGAGAQRALRARPGTAAGAVSCAFPARCPQSSRTNHSG